MKSFDKLLLALESIINDSKTATPRLLSEDGDVLVFEVGNRIYVYDDMVMKAHLLCYGPLPFEGYDESYLRFIPPPDDESKLAAYALMRGKRMPEFEDKIAKHPKGSLVTYAVRFFEERWLEAEETILKMRDYGLVQYCQHFGRIAEFEKVAITKGFLASNYASEVMCREWPEAEPIIFDKGGAWLAQYSSVLTRRLSWDIEDRLLNFSAESELDLLYAAQYSAHVLQRRWPEFEFRVPENKCWKALTLGTYLLGLRVGGVEWPEGEVMFDGLEHHTPEDWIESLGKGRCSCHHTVLERTKI